MALQPPKIDQRTEADILIQTVTLAQYYTSWVEPTPLALRDRILAEELELEDGTVLAPGTHLTMENAVKISEEFERPIGVKGWNTLAETPQLDAGLALMQIFGAMATLVSDRLNRSLDKNFLAFLNTIGTQIQPPRPAWVPLTFELATGSTAALVPAGTQVAAPPLGGEEEEVIFETERVLAMTSVQLQGVFVRQPDLDSYSDRTERGTGQEDGDFAAFVGVKPVEHSFYLAQSELFTLAEPKQATITFDSTNARGLAALPITWSYWDGTVWHPLLGIIEGLTVVVHSSQKEVRVRPGTAVNSQGQQISLTAEETIDLSDRSNETLIIVISDNAGSPEVEAVEITSTDTPAETHIRLAYLQVDEEGDISKSLPEDTGDESTWQLSLGNLPVPTEVSINGIEAAWLKAELRETSLPPDAALPQVSPIHARVNCSRDAIAPDLAFFNTTTIDLSKDFYPLGEDPRFNDTFYLASEDVFSKAGTAVKVNITLSEGVPINPDADAEVLWEAWDGTTWQVLPVNDAEKPQANFTASGEVTLQLPENMAPIAVNDESNYWLRARLVGGNYGTDAADGNGGAFIYLTEEVNSGDRKLNVNDVRGFMPGDRIIIAVGGEDQESKNISAVDTSNHEISLQDDLANSHPENTSVLLQDDGILAPPSVKSLTLSYDYKSGDRSLDYCLTYNNFAFTVPDEDRFPLFTSTTEIHPALYLGFDLPFPNQLTTLYFRVAPPLPGEVRDRQTVTEPAKVVWEYATAEGWKLLEASDETESFAQRGLIQFIGPTDFAARWEFGQQLYWLRGRWESGQFQIEPRLQRILTNTTWASQTVTQMLEILGSSDGNASQSFFTSQSPVLIGQQLQVQEQNDPLPEEKAAIEATLGSDAIETIADETGQVLEVWVPWHQVPDFYASGPGDRHYLLDRLTGEVRFGDGQFGMVPPPLRNNIRMTYQTGGGTQGNLDPETIVQLKTTLSYVDSVANLEAASGGAEQESLERVREQGPKALRHRNRAVAAEDIEDLAFEASSEVARALAITPHFDPTQLTWLPAYNITLDSAGDILVTVRVMDPAGEQKLEVIIYGPGRGVPFHRETITVDRDSPPDEPQVSYSVSEADFAAGDRWQVSLTIADEEDDGDDEEPAVSGEITIEYPGGSINNNSFSGLTADPNSIDDAGQVTLIIVPYSDALPPTPSLGLVNLVEAYLLARSSATLSQIRVTEPDWVEVTVSATIAPVSFDLADRARTAARVALNRFLNPLTGGRDGRGWAFGRQPYESDVYALLDAVPEVDRVETLEITVTADGLAIAQLTETQLIFSGNHEVNLTM